MSERFMAMAGLKMKKPSLNIEELSNEAIELGGSVDFHIEPDEESEGVFPSVIRCNGFKFAVLFIDTPIPTNVLSDAYAESSLPWPDAHAEFGVHNSHIAISTVGSFGKRKEFLHAALTATVILGAIVQITDAVGVYWSGAEWLTPREDVLEAARAAGKGEPPVNQWIRLSLRPGRNAVGIFTYGLLPFAGREIEFPPNSSVNLDMMIDRVMNLSLYLVEQGLVVQDKDTIGIDDKKQIRITYGKSHFLPGTPVLILSVERI